MSLYEINSMIAALDKESGKSGDRLMTDEEYEAGIQRWRDMNLPDVKV